VTRIIQAILLTALVAAGAGGCGREAGTTPGGRAPLIGAYYYVWYDQAEWDLGYLGRELQPPVTPLLGEYASADPRTAAQHIRWAGDYGIDFFAVSWPGRASRQDRYLRAGLLAAPNLDDIRFAIFYESLLALGTPKGEIRLDDVAIERLRADVEYLGREYLAHPRYLRIGGRPALFLYVTRILTGRHREAIAVIRRTLARQGHAVYLIGDEVFWQIPSRDRIRLFDAITAYNMYDWPRTEQGGYAAGSAFLGAVQEQYERFRRVAGDGHVAFVPSVIPGYNDRGVRPREDHYVIPRLLSPDADEGSLFARSLQELGLALLDDRNPLLMITSFNEWHEWSQIEPARPGPPTTRDPSYTLDFPHRGYGLRYLEVLRDAVVAVSGRLVRGPGKDPVRGAEVRAVRGGVVTATVRTDSTGAFRFARRALPPDRYELVADRGRARLTVDVGASWTGPVELVVE
jgi:hypothetical protein